MAVRGTLKHRRWVPLVTSLWLVALGAAGAKHYVFDLISAPRPSWCYPRDQSLSAPGIVLSCAVLFLGILSAASTTSRWNRAHTERRSWDDLFRDAVSRRVTQHGWLLCATIVAAAVLVYAWVRAHLWVAGYG